MARKIDAFPAAPSQRYPWDEWLNGEVWQLVEAEDYRAKPSTVITGGRARARRMGGRLRTRMLDEGGRRSIVVQFVKS